jgi:UDP-N-acetylmuramyl pentapeptide synthase
MSASFTVGQAALAAGARLLRSDAAARLQGVFTDTHKPERGALFVALNGENHDGSAYAVAEAGAAAVLVPERSAAKVAAELAPSAALLVAHDTGRALALLAQAWRGQQRNLRVIAITGSTGKTWTKS